MLSGPLLKLFGMSDYQNTEYLKELEKIEDAAKNMEEIIGE
jgi:hypothetical protein